MVPFHCFGCGLDWRLTPAKAAVVTCCPACGLSTAPKFVPESKPVPPPKPKPPVHPLRRLLEAFLYDDEIERLERAGVFEPDAPDFTDLIPVLLRMSREREAYRDDRSKLARFWDGIKEAIAESGRRTTRRPVPNVAPTAFETYFMFHPPR